MFRKLLLPSIFLIVATYSQLWSQQTGELFFSSQHPLGNVAVSKLEKQPAYFFTLHPEGKPTTNKVFRITEGKATAFPDSLFQQRFVSPLGIYLDVQNRLWVLDHGNYALKTPRLFAFDAATGELLCDYSFPRDIVRKWVMLNDLSITPDGKYVVISAPGMFKNRSSIIVYDVSAGESKRILTDHPSVMRKKMLPEVDGIKMRFLLGLFKVRPGVDGIDIDPWGKYLYYAPMADTVLYRIPVDACTDFSLGDNDLKTMVQVAGYRPLCDGIRVDRRELVYITDFQNHRILSLSPEGESSIVVRNHDIRWADGLSVGADGYLYITDSALQYVIMKKKKKYQKHAPFGIWRIKLENNRVQ